MTIDYLLQLALMFAVSVITYHHLGYPALLKILASRRRALKGEAGTIPKQEVPVDDLPSIALLVPAHNEAKYITRKIHNIATIQYPSGLLAVTLAFDGCTDGTPELAKEALNQTPIAARVKLVEFPRNVGKVAVLNTCIAEFQTELVALSDASAQISTDALVRAAAHFQDPRTGVVCGTYELRTPFNEGERAYWRYQTDIKIDEATLAAPIGAHGAFYLFRKRAWKPLESDTINDDFVLPMRIVAAGYAAVYDDQIVAVELEQTLAVQEFSRRVRIGAGNMQQSVRLIELMNPQRGWLAFMLLSGKGLRPFIPFVALGGVAACALLAARGYTWALWLLCIMFFAIFLPLLLPRSVIAALPKPTAWARYFIEGYAASFVGALKYIFSMNHTWRPRLQAD